MRSHSRACLRRSFRSPVAMEAFEPRKLMADFRLTSLRLVDEDFLVNPSPSITLNGAGDRIYQQVFFNTTSVPSAPDVEYHFTTLGSTRIAKDSSFSSDTDGTGTWVITWGSWQVATAGAYQATATLDATNLVAETDETNNSATINYNAVASPEIRVFGLNSDKIVDGQTKPSVAEGTDFGFLPESGSPPERTFTVRNIGVLPMTTSGLSVPEGFSIVEGLSPTIASGGSDTFTLRLNTAQAIRGPVSFTNNDLNEGTFNFPIQGNVPNPAATSTVFDVSVTPARVLVGFNTNVGASVTSGDFKITNAATGATVPSTVSYDASTNTAKVAFTTAPANGRYHLAATAASITDAYGTALTAPVSYDFSYVRGDLDGDGAVGFSDLVTLAQNYGQTGRTFAQGNLNYSADGLVDFGDLVILAQLYGSTLPAQMSSIGKPAKRVADDVLS